MSQILAMSTKAVNDLINSARVTAIATAAADATTKANAVKSNLSQAIVNGGTTPIQTATNVHADMDGMLLTIAAVPAGADIAAFFSSVFRTGLANQNLSLKILIDPGSGSYSISNTVEITLSSAGGNLFAGNITCNAQNVVGGTCRVKVQWAAVEGTKYQDVYNRSLTALVAP